MESCRPKEAPKALVHEAKLPVCRDETVAHQLPNGPSFGWIQQCHPRRVERAQISVHPNIPSKPSKSAESSYHRDRSTGCDWSVSPRLDGNM